MKPLTKEEFLERKNSQIHKELLAVFESKSNSDAIARWFRQFEKDNPKLQLCRFMCLPKVSFNVTYNYQGVFLRMCEMLKTGDLVVIDKPRTLHILIWSEQGGGMDIKGVFSSDEKANQYLDKYLVENKHACKDDYSVEEMIIDLPI